MTRSLDRKNASPWHRITSVFTTASRMQKASIHFQQKSLITQDRRKQSTLRTTRWDLHAVNTQPGRGNYIMIFAFPSAESLMHICLNLTVVFTVPWLSQWQHDASCWRRHALLYTLTIYSLVAASSLLPIRDPQIWFPVWPFVRWGFPSSQSGMKEENKKYNWLDVGMLILILSMTAHIYTCRNSNSNNTCAWQRDGSF